MEIFITSPKYGLFKIQVDDEDYEGLSKYHWTITKNKNFYAVRDQWANNKAKRLYMHRQIMGFPKGIVDHRDCDTLNNRKSNLRIVNNGDSQKNRRIQSNSTSGYKGVSYYKAYDKYSAQLGLDYKCIFGGYYDTALEAAYAYNELAKAYYGEYAQLNVFTDQEQGRINDLLKNGFKIKKVRRYERKMFRGVSKPIKAGQAKPYYAALMINNKLIRLGYFATEVEAAKAYNEALIKNDGDLRKLNKIPNE